ncbi:MAG: S1 RNA-binding domain-containing protein, partial [Oligoflexia bacterium]|nr:S1 RNA-binding domain-containing protein [Oligoflexia bacterium]
PGIEGLIHISELSVQRVETTSQAVQLGDLLRVEVLNIDLEARKIGLSVKQVQLREEQQSDASPVNVEEKSNNEEQPVSPKKKKEESFFGRALKASLGVTSSSSTKATKADSSSDPE